MRLRSISTYRAFQALFVATSVCMSAPALAGDPSSFVKGVSDAPPEAQVQMVRIVLNSMFGTPEEVRVNFAAACDKRLAPSAATAKPALAKKAEPISAMLQTRVAGASKEATLMALCATSVRKGIEAVLVQETLIEKRRVAAGEVIPSSR